MHIVDYIENEQPTIILQVKDELEYSEISYPECTIGLDGKNVNMFADSCFPFTLLYHYVFAEIFKNVQYVLKSPAINPGGYNKDPIPLEGMVKMKITLKGRSMVGTVYIVKTKGSHLLDWRHQKELGMNLDPNNSEQVMIDLTMVLEHICEGFPKMFSDRLGLLKGFQHKSKLKITGTPVVYKAHPILLLMKEPLQRKSINHFCKKYQ